MRKVRSACSWQCRMVSSGSDAAPRSSKSSRHTRTVVWTSSPWGGGHSGCSSSIPIDLLLHGAVDFLEGYSRVPESNSQAQLVELYETCHTLLYSSLPKSLKHFPEERLSYAIGSTLPLELMWKQQILELRSEADRQERLVTYLPATGHQLPHLEKNEVMRQRAGGNGRGLN